MNNETNVPLYQCRPANVFRPGKFIKSVMEPPREWNVPAWPGVRNPTPEQIPEHLSYATLLPDCHHGRRTI